MSNALSVSDLICRYNGQAVLSDLSLNVEKGEIVCLLGASGCGKTTLLKAIAGLLPLDGGKMSINGRTIIDDKCNVPPELRNVGMIFQDYALFPNMTMLKNIYFGEGSEDNKEIVSELIHVTNIEKIQLTFRVEKIIKKLYRMLMNHIQLK